MILENELLAQYRPEIDSLYLEHFHETTSGLKTFGIFTGDILMAAGSVKNYMGTRYLRGCVVKEDYRGQGLQRELIRERLAWLAPQTNIVRVSILPTNIYSINNVEAEGFEYEKIKVNDGIEYWVYKILLS